MDHVVKSRAGQNIWTGPFECSSEIFLRISRDTKGLKFIETRYQGHFVFAIKVTGYYPLD